MTEEQVPSSRPLPDVLKLKLQLFHRLQRCNRDAWKQYWRSFQQYLVAKLSLEEFHGLAEELLGSDKHLHNEFVAALLCTTYERQEIGHTELWRNSQLSETPEAQERDRKAKGETRPSMVAEEDVCTTRRDGSLLLQMTTEERARHVGGDCGQKEQAAEFGRKRPNSRIEAAGDSTEAAACTKRVFLDREQVLERYHSDHQSAQLLMGLGKCATAVSAPSIAATPEPNPSMCSKEHKSCVVSGDRPE
uniref:Uncharacterized protein n=1 Tax=Peronospora matthiolae TaxID=2874970 RepID=A0AAV1TP78_9STRA